MKRALLTVLLGLSTSLAWGQFLGLKTSSQKILEDAIVGSFLVLNQQYDLVSSNERYSIRGADFFGEIPFLGIITEEGMIVSSQILYPWGLDPSYKDYKDQYSAALSRTKYLGTYPSSMENILLSKENLIHLKDSSVCIYNELSGTSGLVIDRSAGEKRGWFTWVSMSNTGEIHTSLEFKDLTISKGEKYEVEIPNSSFKLVGGFYISVDITPGSILLKLNGIVINNGVAWELVCPFIEEPTSQPILKTSKKNGTYAIL